jgi:hypothetical protein
VSRAATTLACLALAVGMAQVLLAALGLFEPSWFTPLHVVLIALPFVPVMLRPLLKRRGVASSRIYPAMIVTALGSMALSLWFYREVLATLAD